MMFKRSTFQVLRFFNMIAEASDDKRECKSWCIQGM